MSFKSGQKRSADDPGPSKEKAGRPTAKKTRFVSPSQDPTAFESKVEDALENPSLARKGRVKIDGYDSDSTDDGEGVVLSRRKNGDGDGEGGEDGEDDDMFAPTSAKNDDKKGDPKNGKDEFMRLGDIEGQEFNEGDGDSDSGEEDEPEDEDDAERRKKAGMGYELSRFNMREEMEEGRFSADGMYVKAYDPFAVHDRWIEDMDEREIKKAKRSKKRMEKAEREKQAKELEEGEQDPEESRKELLGLLRKGETVLEGLGRLGEKAKKEKAAAKTKSSTGSHMLAHPDPTTQADIDRLTSLASKLLNVNTDIYSETYESILRSIRSKGNVEPDWEPPSKQIRYEYRWAETEDGVEREVFGPFDESDMRAWYGAAYFGTAGEKIEAREVGKEDWGSWEEVIG